MLPVTKTNSKVPVHHVPLFNTTQKVALSLFALISLASLAYFIAYAQGIPHPSYCFTIALVTFSVSSVACICLLLKVEKDRRDRIKRLDAQQKESKHVFSDALVKTCLYLEPNDISKVLRCSKHTNNILQHNLWKPWAALLGFPSATQEQAHAHVREFFGSRRWVAFLPERMQHLEFVERNLGLLQRFFSRQRPLDVRVSFTRTLPHIGPMHEREWDAFLSSGNNPRTQAHAVKYILDRADGSQVSIILSKMASPEHTPIACEFILLLRKRDLALTDREGQTLLHLFFRKKNARGGRELIKHAAEITDRKKQELSEILDVPDGRSTTPYYEALYNGLQEEFLQALLEAFNTGSLAQLDGLEIDGLGFKIRLAQHAAESDARLTRLEALVAAHIARTQATT